jgi:hypothetical protein
VEDIFAVPLVVESLRIRFIMRLKASISISAVYLFVSWNRIAVSGVGASMAIPSKYRREEFVIAAIIPAESFTNCRVLRASTSEYVALNWGVVPPV